MAMEPLKGVDWLAEILDVKKSWVYNNYAKLGIPHVKVGNAVKFRPSAVERWIEEHSSEGRQCRP